MSHSLIPSNVTSPSSVVPSSALPASAVPASVDAPVPAAGEGAYSSSASSPSAAPAPLHARRDAVARVAIPLGAVLAALPFVSVGEGLLLGATLALTVGNPHLARTRRASHTLLALAVVGLGAGLDLRVVARVGLHGIGETALSIAGCLTLAMLLARLLRVPRDTALLVGVGTAICGGSAIAAIAPILRARDHEVSVALGVVFLLNAVALFLFPAVGHALALPPERFGAWAALAIHDTSSVVGASMAYAPAAVAVATTLKLTRALWILPVALGVARVRRADGVRNSVGNGVRAPMPRPWFILGFLVASALATFVPSLHTGALVLSALAQRAMVVALFLVGAGLSRQALRSVGVRPLLLGMVLWVAVAVTTLVLIGMR